MWLSLLFYLAHYLPIFDLGGRYTYTRVNWYSRSHSKSHLNYNECSIGWLLVSLNIASVHNRSSGPLSRHHSQLQPSCYEYAGICEPGTRHVSCVCNWLSQHCIWQQWLSYLLRLSLIFYLARYLFILDLGWRYAYARVNWSDRCHNKSHLNYNECPIR